MDQGHYKGKERKIWAFSGPCNGFEWPEAQSCRIYVRAVQKSPRADGSSVLRANELSGKSEMPSLPDSTHHFDRVIRRKKRKKPGPCDYLEWSLQRMF